MPTGTKDGRPQSNPKRVTRSARTSARGTPARRGGRRRTSASAAIEPLISPGATKPAQHVRVVLLTAAQVRKIVKTFLGNYLAFKVIAIEHPKPTGRAMKALKGGEGAADNGKADREKTTLIVALAPSRPGTE